MDNIMEQSFLHNDEESISSKEKKLNCAILICKLRIVHLSASAIHATVTPKEVQKYPSETKLRSCNHKREKAERSFKGAGCCLSCLTVLSKLGRMMAFCKNKQCLEKSLE